MAGGGKVILVLSLRLNLNKNADLEYLETDYFIRNQIKPDDVNTQIGEVALLSVNFGGELIEGLWLNWAKLRLD